MKRDMDLVRKILFTIEEHDGPLQMGDYGDLQCSNDKLYYHLCLLYDGGFIKGEDISSTSGEDFYVTSMRWNGHEFLDAARDPSRWQQAKVVAGKAGSVTIEVLKSILTHLATEAVKKIMAGG